MSTRNLPVSRVGMTDLGPRVGAVGPLWTEPPLQPNMKSSLRPHSKCVLIKIYFFETGSHAAWKGLRLAMQPRLSLELLILLPQFPKHHQAPPAYTCAVEFMSTLEG